MDKKSFSSVLKKLTEGKRLFIIGIVGILLIGLSSFSSKKPKSNTEAKASFTDVKEYVTDLQNRIREIVVGLSGDKSATVVITLETGVRREYAGETQDSTSQKSGNSVSETDTDVKKKAITVKTSDGSEEALIVTEYMPQIRGVAIVCKAGGNEQIKKDISDAVTAALGITSKRVYIGGN